MRLNAVVDITKGELLNSSFVNSFENIRVNPKKVTREDLFIGKDLEDINLAIENGAYGVLFEKNLDINEEEVALIKVKSVGNASRSLVRYFIASKNIKSYKIDKKSFLVGKEISRSKKALFVESDDVNRLLTKRPFDDVEVIFFYEDMLAEQVLPDVSTPSANFVDFEILKSSLFFTELKIKEESYKIGILKYYLQSLIEMISIFEDLKLEYRIKEHFTTNEIIKEKTKTIILSKDRDLFNYVKENSPWAIVVD
ncbi:MAG: hypothetical protein OIF32_06045, partial [Campylobacterales bacterium]|nr:hypothetical protein [Campylobacterales bacterium]